MAAGENGAGAGLGGVTGRGTAAGRFPSGATYDADGARYAPGSGAPLRLDAPSVAEPADGSGHSCRIGRGGARRSAGCGTEDGGLLRYGCGSGRRHGRGAVGGQLGGRFAPRQPPRASLRSRRIGRPGELRGRFRRHERRERQVFVDLRQCRGRRRPRRASVRADHRGEERPTRLTGEPSGRDRAATLRADHQGRRHRCPPAQTRVGHADAERPTGCHRRAGPDHPPDGPPPRPDSRRRCATWRPARRQQGDSQTATNSATARSPRSAGSGERAGRPDRGPGDRDDSRSGPITTMLPIVAPSMPTSCGRAGARPRPGPGRARRGRRGHRTWPTGWQSWR